MTFLIFDKKLDILVSIEKALEALIALMNEKEESNKQPKTKSLTMDEVNYNPQSVKCSKCTRVDRLFKYLNIIFIHIN